MLGDAVVTWRGAEVPGLSGKGSWSSPYWASYTESKKSCQGHGIEEGWETETCRGRGQAETIWVLETAPEHWSFGVHWDFPCYGVQM